MSDNKVHPGHGAPLDKPDGQELENSGPLGLIPSLVQKEKKSELIAEIGHVANLGIENIPAIEKKIVRRLDTWMLPQLWILYMFNYLNRTNIAQARLNTFDEDLNLQDGDYQVCWLDPAR